MPSADIVAPEDAVAFLDDFTPTIRERGELYFRQEAVEHMEVLEPGESYRFRVRGSAIYHVEVFRDGDDGWTAACDCPYDAGYCKHAYAALLTVLDRAGIDPSDPDSVSRREDNAPENAKPVAGADCVWDRFVEAKGAAPSEPEAELLRAITSLYHAIVSDGEYLCGRSLKRIGIGPLEDNWSMLRIWPEPPVDDHEFWLYVTLFAQENKLRLPDFMAPISHLGRIEPKIARARRGRAIERWQSFFERASLAEYSPESLITDRPESELRLRLLKGAAVLEIRQPEETDFVAMTDQQFDGLPQAMSGGKITLTPIAELLWGRMGEPTFGGVTPTLRYSDSEAGRILHGICHTPALRDSLFLADGSPVVWSNELLRWQLTDPAADPEDDYRLVLAYADGSPCDVGFSFAGAPSYFIARSKLHAGPPFDPTQLNPRKSIRLPKAAVENRTGIEFLHRLGTVLPEPLARRIRSVTLTPRIVCRLETGAQEQCELTVTAVNQAGEEQEEWRDQRWQPLSGAMPPSDSGSPDPGVEIINREKLTGVPSLIARLNARQHEDGKFTLKVGRNFPDRFCEWLETLPAEVDVQLEGQLAGLRERAVSGSIRLDVEETEIDWFDLSIAVEVEDTDLTPEEIKLLLNAKGGWVRLEDKGWRRLTFELTEDDDEQLARLGLSARELNAEPQRIHALQLANTAAQKFLPAEQCERLRLRAEEIQARVTPDIPATISAKMRPYQTEGFHFLAYLSANRFGGILADDMGLGKTLQALTWLIWLREKGETGPSLVVCPKSVMDNWLAETERFTSGLRTKVWHRTEIDDLPERTNDADLHVINYNQLRKLGERLLPIRFLTVILDEGQYVKNPYSQTARTARALSAAHRLVLSGTPIENRLMDLWSLMSFAMPGVLGSRTQFGKLYNAKDDPFARLRLSSRVRPFLIRRTKSQVAQDLPERIEEDLYCEIDGEQKKLYQAERKRAQQILLGVKTPQQLNDLRFNFLTSLLHLRQICCHPRLFRKTSRASSAKLEAVLEQLDPIMAEGNKVLVFSQFVELLNLIEPELVKNDWPVWKLTGRTEERGKLVEDFQNHEGPGVFLISLKAGGSGLNLTAASYVVLFDPWWNPAVENQAIDRTHRIGQTTKVIAYRLLIKNSIEEKIRELQKQKQALAADVLGEEKFSAALTVSDFQYLLSD